MSNNKGMRTRSYTQIINWHSSNTPLLAAGFFIRSKGNKSLDLREVLSELEKVGINNLEDYEWVDNIQLTENS